jgi:putative NIF3 family GTP cyclohydrolase 1 type 2
MAGAALLASTAVARAATGKSLKAGDIVERIKTKLGHPWEVTNRDTFKCGGPDSDVYGIATSFGGDLRVLQRSQAQGLNMLIVHEPTFYSDLDVLNWVKDDPVYTAKRKWMEANNMVVWRTHDNWHARKPYDGIRAGWERGIGWEKYLVPGNARVYKIPPTTLGGLAKYIATTLKSHSLRVIGDPNLPVTVVARGGHQLADNVAATGQSDVLLISETREYDSYEYLRDSVISGERKGIIIISHVTGEDTGMEEMVRYLKPMVKEIPIKFVSTDDAYWTV